MDTDNAVISSSESATSSAPLEPQHSNYFGWFKSTLSQSIEVWNSIKRDISEVAQSVATSDSISAAKGTASSVYRQFSEAVQSLQQEGAQAEPLPEEPISTSDHSTDDSDLSAQFSHFKSSFTGIVSALEKGISELAGGNFNFYFGSSESGTSGDNREARIEVIRADPATYEQMPLTAQKNILPYLLWRDAYFDEHTCCPHPGIPVFEGETIPKELNSTLTTTYSPPAQVLEESSVVRSHLLRLVDPDGGDNSRGIQENDFWSRYYYRVWCLDVLELRRSRLSRISAGVRGRIAEKEDQNFSEAWPELEEEEEKLEEANANAVKEKNLKSEKRDNSQLTTRDQEIALSSPASSVVLVNKEELVESSEDNENRSDDYDEDLTQLEPPRGTFVDKEVDGKDGAVEITTETLKVVAEKLENALAGSNDGSDDGVDGDKSETESEWEKWT